MEKGCLECGDELFGRVDKKFCSDQCRSTYYNKLKSNDNNLVRNVNSILRKNRKILSELIKNKKSNREKMLEQGFNFNYYTNTYTTKDSRIYYYCYDFGYLELDGNWYALVKKLDGLD